MQIDAFFLGDVKQVLGDDLCRNGAQVEALAAGQNRRENLVRLRRREDELHVLRRLFQGLQQGIKGRCRKHVDLVNIVDLELSTRRGEADRFADLADIIDRVVRGAVDLQHVERATLGDLAANIFVRVEIRLWTVGAVEGLC